VTIEDGQVVMTEGADVLLAGEGGVVLGGRVAEVTGGRVVIDLDGAGQPEDRGPEDGDGLAEFAEAERLAAIGWVLTAPGAFLTAALVRDMPVMAARWIGRRWRKATHADWVPSDTLDGR
jgi:hypothetical protein